jgi:sugar/nucleoside kinase (ribokinase family)
MSALVVEYLKSNDIDKAINFANKCASEVVKYRGVSLI